MKIIIKNLQKKIPIHPKRIKETILKTLSLKGIKKSGEITVCFVSDKRIKELNLRYLGKNFPTDVITFDYTKNPECSNFLSNSSGSRRVTPEKKLHSGEEILADIVVSTDTAVSNARIFKTSPSDELYLYVIHGTLHLLGYNDQTPKQKQIMRSKEKGVLIWLSTRPRQ